MYQKHTKDHKKWSQEEKEEHGAALSGDHPCYFCIAVLEERALERGVSKEVFNQSLKGQKNLVIEY